LRFNSYPEVVIPAVATTLPQVAELFSLAAFYFKVPDQPGMNTENGKRERNQFE
jgi:hypothetical protein